MTTETYGCLKQKYFITHLILFAFAAGCTTMQPVPASDAQSLANHLEAGDKIKITRNDNTELTLTVGSLSEQGISGDGQFVAYSDIRQVQVSQTNNGAVWGIVAGVAIVAVLIGAGGGSGY